MKAAQALCILLFATFTNLFASASLLQDKFYNKLYTDAEIQIICKKFQSHGDDFSLLSIVPISKTKKISVIFKELGIDRARLEAPEIRDMNLVKIYRWRVSPGFVLSIMTAINDRENDFSDVSKLNGYGVRIRSSYEK